MSYDPEETAAEILARNVQRLIDVLGSGSQSGLSRATRVPQKTISRALGMENSPQLATVEDLARGCGFYTWQLLVPDFDPKKPPATVARIYTTRIDKIAATLERVPPEHLHLIEELAEVLAAKAATFPGDTDDRAPAEAN